MIDSIAMASRSKTTAAKSRKSARPSQSSGKDVAEALRQQIRVGRLVPGQRLVEIDIVNQFHTTRGKVREALKRLEAEGLVTIEEFRGASVKHFTLDEIRQIYDTRMALEGLAAREFAAHGTDTQKQRLAEIQEALNEGDHSGNHDRFSRLNDDWHTHIIQCSGNAYVAMFLERLRIPIYRLLFLTFYSAQRIDNANADHRKITAAILAGDPDKAERLMRRHISDGFAALAELDLDR